MPKEARDELREEWVLLQNQYEDFDKRALTLKGLATPLLGIGYAAGAKEHSIGVVLATIVVAACLWALETQWKTFQYCLTDRIKALEAYFREPEANPDFKPYQIFTSWGEVYRRDRFNWELWRQRAMMPFVMLPYLPMILAGVLLAGSITITITQTEQDKIDACITDLCLPEAACQCTLPPLTPNGGRDDLTGSPSRARAVPPASRGP